MAETIEIQTPDGPAEAYLARPDDGPRPEVLFYMDAFGLRPRIEEMVERIASWGYVVLAPHVFHREGRVADLAPAGDLTLAENREKFFAHGGMARVGRLTPDRSDPDSRLWVDTLLQHARAEFVYGHADGDRSMPPEAVEALGHALEQAGLRYSNEVYPGTRHGYTMADTAPYDEAATERHFAALRELFERTL